MHPDAEEIYYDGEDGNCDGKSDYDADEDGFDSATEEQEDGSFGEDCDDDNAGINPGVAENPNDGADTDCDGVGDARFQIGYVDSLCIDCAGPSGIAVDSAGQVHVVYEDNGRLWYRYLQNEFGNWSSYEIISTDSTRTVAHETDDRYGLDSRVDATDNVQVGYISTGTSDTALHYLFRNSDGEWSEEAVIDSVEKSGDDSVGYFVEMEIDSNNKPIFGYYNETQGLPYLFDFTDPIIDFVVGGGNGESLPLDYFADQLGEESDAYSGTYVSLAQDSHDVTHLVYYNDNEPSWHDAFQGKQESQYNRIPDLSSTTIMQNASSILNDPLTFAATFVTSDVCWPGYSIANDATHNSTAIHGNQFCVAYKNESDGNLYYGCKSTSATCDGWLIEPAVDTTGNVGDYATLAFNSEGQPYIAYQNATLKHLKVATKENGAWEVITVDDSGNAGKFADMTIDNNDVVHISYLDGSTGKGLLKYAWGQ